MAQAVPHKGLIACTIPGQSMPDDFVEAVLQKYDTYFSAAVADQGKLTFMPFTDKKKVSLAGVNTIQKAFKDFHTSFFFASAPVSIAKEDLQPFNVLNDEQGVSQIICFLEGEFDQKYHIGGSSLASPAMQVANRLITPRIAKLYRISKQDLKGVMDELGEEETTDEFLESCPGGGSFLFISSSNIIRSAETKRDSAEFPWGFATDSMGFASGSEGVVEEEIEDDDPAAQMAKAMGAAAPATTKPAPEASKEKVEMPSLEPKGGKNNPPQGEANLPDNTIFPPAKGTKKEDAINFYQCPSGKTHKEIRRDYRREAGWCPENYVKRPKVSRNWEKIKDAGVLKTLAAVGQALGVAPPTDTAIPAQAIKPAAAVAPTDNKKSVTTQMEEKMGGILPTLSVEEVKNVREKFLSKGLKLMKRDTNGNEVMAADEILEVEASLPTFSEMFGMEGIEDTFSWHWQDFKDLAEVDSKAAAILWKDYRWAYLTLLKGEKLPDGVHRVPDKKPALVSKPAVPASAGTPKRRAIG